MSSRVYSSAQLRSEIKREAAMLFTDLMARGNRREAGYVAAIELGDAEAATVLLCEAGVWDEKTRDRHPLILCHTALGVWIEIVKTWDDPWTWPPLRYLYPFRHPLLWLYQHSGGVRRRWDRRIRERVEREDR